jgi:hypothetical protein
MNNLSQEEIKQSAKNAHWCNRNTLPTQKGFYKVKISTGDGADDVGERDDYFDGGDWVMWGYRQFINEWWTEKISVPFEEIQQGAFFDLPIPFDRVRLCRFGIYGMGVGKEGNTVSKVIDPQEEVLAIDLKTALNSTTLKY